MKYVLAPDSFKENMTSLEAAAAMERGIKKVDQNAQCVKIPLADGGEGTVDSLVIATGGKKYESEVMGPTGEPVVAEYGILGDGKTAVIEVASCCGIHLVSGEKRNPYFTTTYGVGQLISSVLDDGISNIIIGLGGSCTNDGGSGMLSALGIKFLDVNSKPIPLGGGFLDKIASIDMSGFDERIKQSMITIASDVTNPLIGEQGASHVFGPQKGANADMVKLLDANLCHYAKFISQCANKDISLLSGAGAAGGLGAAFLAFFPCNMQRGIDLVLEYTNFEERINDADYVFTGEGSIDGQTVFGKTPYGIAKKSQKHGVPVIAFAGKVGKDIEQLYQIGIKEVVCISCPDIPLAIALKEGKQNLCNAVVDFLSKQ